MLFPFVRLTLLYKGTACVPFHSYKQEGQAKKLPRHCEEGVARRGNLLARGTGWKKPPGDCHGPDGPRNDSGSRSLVLLIFTRNPCGIGGRFLNRPYEFDCTFSQNRRGRRPRRPAAAQRRFFSYPAPSGERHGGRSLV